jgi:DNA repair protein RadC
MGSSIMQLYVARDGGFKEATDREVLAAAQGAVRRKFNRGPRFSSPALVKEALVALLGARESEVFCVAHLDQRHRLIRFVEMFEGSIDGASVHPREVVKAALAHNSASLVFVHNHPSGDFQASNADEMITRRLKEACALIDVRVLDHIIIGADGAVSMAETGRL